MPIRPLHPTALAVLATSALYLAIPAARAADTLPLQAADFASLDVNRDGYIDAKEAAAVPAVANALKTGDKDRDGRLSETEYLALAQPRK